MRVAIDARKLHDFGIGTYIRNLLRHVARIDHDTEYVLLCREPDLGVAAELGRNFRTVLEPSPNYSVREQVHVPWVLRRERPVALDAVAQALPCHEGHREKVPPADRTDFVHGHDAGVVEPRSRFGLAKEPLDLVLVGQLAGLDHLQGHQPVELHLPGLEHDAHASFGDFAEQLVREGVLQAVSLAEIPVPEGREAAEMMLIGSSIKVAPVVEWDGEKIGDGKPGPLANRLLAMWNEDTRSAPDQLVAVPYDKEI